MFCKKSNEKTSAIEEQIHAECKKLLLAQQISSALQRAMQALEEGSHFLKSRQKPINCSEFGWSVVSEYDADELTEDSNNEEKIEKAEKAAERKMSLACRK